MSLTGGSNLLLMLWTYQMFFNCLYDLIMYIPAHVSDDIFMNNNQSLVRLLCNKIVSVLAMNWP